MLPALEVVRRFPGRSSLTPEELRGLVQEFESLAEAPGLCRGDDKPRFWSSSELRQGGQGLLSVFNVGYGLLVTDKQQLPRLVDPVTGFVGAQQVAVPLSAHYRDLPVRAFTLTGVRGASVAAVVNALRSRGIIVLSAAYAQVQEQDCRNVLRFAAAVTGATPSSITLAAGGRAWDVQLREAPAPQPSFVAAAEAEYNKALARMQVREQRVDFAGHGPLAALAGDRAAAAATAPVTPAAATEAAAATATAAAAVATPDAPAALAAAAAAAPAAPAAPEAPPAAAAAAAAAAAPAAPAAQAAPAAAAAAAVPPDAATAQEMPAATEAAAAATAAGSVPESVAAAPGAAASDSEETDEAMSTADPEPEAAEAAPSAAAPSAAAAAAATPVAASEAGSAATAPAATAALPAAGSDAPAVAVPAAPGQERQRQPVQEEQLLRRAAARGATARSAGHAA